MENKSFEWCKKRHKTLKIVLIVTLIFIWGQSVIPKSFSQVESDAILSVITPFYNIDIGNVNSDKYWLFSDIIRKLAHVIEYMILGTEMRLYSFFWITIKKCEGSPNSTCITSPAGWGSSMLFLMLVALIGMLIALMDETLQIFSNRGSMILDVWIDSLGIVIGIIIGSKIIRRYNRKQKLIESMNYNKLS